MKKSLLYLINVSFAIVLVMFFNIACNKTSAIQPVQATTVTGSVAGLVVDLNNNPVTTVAVTAGKASTSTDLSGRFLIKNTDLNAGAGFVLVTKDGFFDGSRTFLVDTGTTNNVRIMLIPKTPSGSFSTSTGGNIN